MQKEQIYELLNANPAFFLATTDQGKPQVRGMLLYKADQEGIVFHTAKMKQVYRQIAANPRAELCFIDQKSGTQVRVSGELQIIDEQSVKEEIVNHPSRAFLRTWKDEGTMKNFYDDLIVLCLKNGDAKVWTMGTNFEEAPVISL